MICSKCKINNGTIKNGLVFTPEGAFEQRDLYIEDGLISDHPVLACPDAEIIDAAGRYVVPGFVDIHTHGAAGHDFCDASKEGLVKISEYMKQHGVTAFLPTSMTFSEEKLGEIFSSASGFEWDQNRARILGINMEGPFISGKRKGAQNAEFIAKPNPETFMRLNKNCGGMIKLVTIAPEVAGGYSFIEEVKDQVHISLGHSGSDYNTARKAFELGADHVTHLFNGMNGFHHRDTGIIGAAADNENVYIELICDGVHISPPMIRAIYRIFGPDRIVAISDSTRACGMADGDYELGGQPVQKAGNIVTLKDGTIAGSASNLFDCFNILLSCGIPLEAALKMVTINPAKSIGMENLAGAFTAGAYADILLLEED